jgi:hypothetical protein
VAAAKFVTPVGFVIANEIVLFAGWSVDGKLFAAIGIGLVLLASRSSRVPVRSESRWTGRPRCGCGRG